MLSSVGIDPRFIDYRNMRAKEYNQGKRSTRKFLMDLDCELYEWLRLFDGTWRHIDDWRVDGEDLKGTTYDVKFINKYWNISRQTMVNILKQRDVVDKYLFVEWVKKPNRPLEAEDVVFFRELGSIPYDSVADNIRTSLKEPYGFYMDVRGHLDGTNKAPSLDREG